MANGERMERRPLHGESPIPSTSSNGHLPAGKGAPSTAQEEDNKKNNDTSQMIASVLIFDLVLLPVIMVFLVDWTVPAPIDPEHFVIPPAVYTGSLTPNGILSTAEKLYVGEVPGPESLIVTKGHIYTGVSNGRILDIHNDKVTILATIKNETCGPLTDDETCGRPLGMRLDKNGDIIVADADLGIFRVNTNTGAKEQLLKASTGIGGRPLKYINDIAIGSDGSIYVTDTSYKWGRKDTFYLLAENRPTGRIFRFDPKSKKTELLVSELYGPNGIQLSANEDFLVFSESPRCRVMRFWLKGDKAGTLEEFASVPGIPDNIRPSKAGGFWVAIPFVQHPTRLWAYDIVASRPWIRRMASKILGKETLSKFLHIPYGLIVELDKTGSLLRSFHDPSGKVLPSVSHVEDMGTEIYLGSFSADYIAKIDLRKL